MIALVLATTYVITLGIGTAVGILIQRRISDTDKWLKERIERAREEGRIEATSRATLMPPKPWQ